MTTHLPYGDIRELDGWLRRRNQAYSGIFTDFRAPAIRFGLIDCSDLCIYQLLLVKIC